MRLSLALAIMVFIFHLTLPAALFATTYSSAINSYERRDYYDAARQFSELAENGDPYAQFMLGRMFANGEGVSKDYVEAYKWLYLADEGGVEPAGDLKKRLAKKMSRKKVNKAKDLASSWQQGKSAGKEPQVVENREIHNRQIVRQVQQELKSLGYYFGKVDGISGPGTSNAIMVYQHSKGVAKDGKITPSLLEMMDISPVVAEVQAPQQDNQELEKLRKDLRSLAKKARKQKSADPWVLNRLEELAGGKVNPWPQIILHEKFKEKSYKGGEAWRVLDGSFRFEPGVGLVGTSDRSWGQTDQVDQLAIDLIDVLVNKKDPMTLTREIARVESGTNFSSTFALTVKTGPLKSTEGLLLSCTTEGASPTGLQLAFHPGQGERAKLFRVSGDSVVEIPAQVSPINFRTNSNHTFDWTRSSNGDMTVTVDGQRILLAKASKHTPQNFNKLTVTHLGKEIIFHEIQLRGNAK